MVLEIKPNKCMMLHLDGNKKYSNVRTGSTISINEISVPVIGTKDVFRYLEIEFL